MSQYGWSDCPADVRRQIENLIENFRSQVGENLVGIYLHGSLAMDCFNPLRSDVDLLVVTQSEIAAKTKRSLAKLLIDASTNPSPIEISFLNLSELSPWRHPTPFDLHYSEDWREKFERSLIDDVSPEWNDRQRFDDDLAAHITVLNHRGLCLYGEPISEVFPTVPEDDFLDSILSDVLSPKYGLDAVLQCSPYVVLNACRTLAYLKTKRILSKDEGGSWALENLPRQYRRTITGALDAYRNYKDKSELAETGLIEFAGYMKQELKRNAEAETRP